MSIVKYSDEMIARVSDVLKAMADPTRLKILQCLKEGELSVSEIIAAVGGSQANVSKHLGVLRRAGLLVSRREGSSIRYRIADDRVFGICDSVCNSIGDRLDREHAMVRTALPEDSGTE